MTTSDGLQLCKKETDSNLEHVCNTIFTCYCSKAHLSKYIRLASRSTCVWRLLEESLSLLAIHLHTASVSFPLLLPISTALHICDRRRCCFWCSFYAVPPSFTSRNSNVSVSSFPSIQHTVQLQVLLSASYFSFLHAIPVLAPCFGKPSIVTDLLLQHHHHHQPCSKGR